MTRCSYFDEEHGCGLGLVEGVPTKADCDSCEDYSGPSRGLGDRIHSVTVRTGIKQVVKKVVRKKDCGCQKRRENLNRKYPTKDS